MKKITLFILTTVGLLALDSFPEATVVKGDPVKQVWDGSGKVTMQNMSVGQCIVFIRYGTLHPTAYKKLYQYDIEAGIPAGTVVFAYSNTCTAKLSFVKE